LMHSYVLLDCYITQQTLPDTFLTVNPETILECLSKANFKNLI